MSSTLKTLLTVTLFTIAMGFMESAVVIYLREIYYKEGFSFPLKPMPYSITLVEILREAATIIMLVAIGRIAGKTKLQRFAYFTLAFAIWDIFYYVFLYIFIDWPHSLFTWDILFLIPMPWVGPVWAPCTISLLMIIGSVFAILQCSKNKNFQIPFKFWVLLIAGALICIVSFMTDYYIFHQNKTAPSTDKILFNEVSGYVPKTFNLRLFLIGFMFMSLPVFYTIFNSTKIKQQFTR